MAGVGGDPRNARYFSVPKQEAMYDAGGEFVQLWVPEMRRRKGFQPSITSAMKEMSVKADEEKRKGDDSEDAMDVDGAGQHSGQLSDSQRVRAEQAVYDITPIVPLLHEPKTDDKGEFLLNKKQRKGGIGIGGYQSVGEIVNPDYARTHGERVSRPQQRPNVGPYGGEALKGNTVGSWKGGGGGGGGGRGGSSAGAASGGADGEHARQGAVRYIGGSERYTGAAASWRAHEGSVQPSTSGWHTGSNQNGPARPSGGGRDPYNRAGGSSQSRGSRGGQQQRQTSMDQFIRR